MQFLCILFIYQPLISLWARIIILSLNMNVSNLASVWEAADLIRHLGRHRLLAKVDLQHAYRMVPVHWDDHHLLGIRWGGEVYIDTALPFGLRSAPKIFSVLADALAWVLYQEGVSYQLHYLDDFLLLGPPGSSACSEALACTQRVCRNLGVPIASHKTEGPSTELTFLGIRIDTVRMELSLPQEKLLRVKSMVLAWRERKVATKRDLQSLVGSLSHAATVIAPGRTFLRRLIETMKIPQQQHHHVRLNAEFQSDIQWWACFLPQWNGKSFLPQADAKHSLVTDASGSWGCGGIGNSLQWFQLEWPQAWCPYHIAAKEMVPVVIAVAIWGQVWQASTVQVQSDNLAMVCALSTGAVRDPLLMHLLRCLHFFAAHYHIVLRAQHIAGASNTAADALSRNKLDIFFSCFLQAAPTPSPIPSPLLDMLIHIQQDWASPSWRKMFLSTLAKH